MVCQHLWCFHKSLCCFVVPSPLVTTGFCLCPIAVVPGKEVSVWSCDLEICSSENSWKCWHEEKQHMDGSQSLLGASHWLCHSLHKRMACTGNILLSYLLIRATRLTVSRRASLFCFRVLFPQVTWVFSILWEYYQNFMNLLVTLNLN